MGDVVVPKINLLWLWNFIENKCSPSTTVTPILEPLRILLSSSILSETSSGYQPIEKLTLTFEQLRWNSQFLHGDANLLTPLSYWFSWFRGINSEYNPDENDIFRDYTLRGYKLLINGKCEQVNTRFLNNGDGDFSLLSYRPKQGSTCGLAPKRMVGYDSFQWVPIVLSSPWTHYVQLGIFSFSSVLVTINILIFFFFQNIY
jgi:hypothetical protein